MIQFEALKSRSFKYLKNLRKFQDHTESWNEKDKHKSIPKPLNSIIDLKLSWKCKVYFSVQLHLEQIIYINYKGTVWFIILMQLW